MKTKTCLFIACYSGPRRFMFPQTIEDRAWFLKQHVNLLSTIPNNLDTIIFTNSPYNLEPTNYTEYWNSIPETLGNAKVIRHQRKENIGMSYGSWNEAYEVYGKDYDFVFILEDDYFAVLPNWDTKLISEFEKKGPKCGYLSMSVNDGSSGPYCAHAAVPMGVMNKQALEAVYSRYGELPHSKSATDYGSNEYGQTQFGNAFIQVGYELYDIRDSYKCVLSMLGNTHTFYDDNENHIIVTAQVLEKNYPQLCMP